MLTKEQLIDKYFVNYVYALWKFLNLPKPTPIQLEIAEYLQYGPDKKMIEGFRGVAKSYLTGGYVTWKLRQDRDYKFEVVSASKSKADEFSVFVKRIINEWDFLAHLRGGVRDSLVAFDVKGAKPSQSPSVKSVGIFGQLTGSRPNEVIADDIEIPANSATEDMRDKLIKASYEFTSLVVPEGGKITYLGTPQSFESIYNTLPDRGFDIRIWPARYPNPNDPSSKIYGDYLAPSIKKKIQEDPSCYGKPTEPTRFNDLVLAEKEGEVGKSYFQLQFMLNTSLSDALKYPLHTSDLIVLPLDVNKAPINLSYGSNPDLQIKDLPNVGFQGDRFYRPFFTDKEEYAPYEGSVMAIDPAGNGQDRIGYAVVKQLHGRLFVTDFGGLQGGYDEVNLVKLATIAKENKVNRILVEGTFGDCMFTQLLKPILGRVYPCTTEDVKYFTQKELRIINTLEPLMNRHKLIFDESAVRRDLKLTEQSDKETAIKHSLFFQMTHITKDRGSLKHDDALDALAMACNYWLTSMSRDEEKAAEDWKERMLQEDLEKFIQGAFFVKDGEGIRFSGEGGSNSSWI